MLRLVQEGRGRAADRRASLVARAAVETLVGAPDEPRRVGVGSPPAFTRMAWNAALGSA